MSELLVGKIWVVQRGDPGFIRTVADQGPAQLGARSRLAAREHQRGVAKIDERDLTAVLDSPTMTKARRQARLTPMRHPCGRYPCCHACIVPAMQDKACDDPAVLAPGA